VSSIRGVGLPGRRSRPYASAGAGAVGHTSTVLISLTRRFRPQTYACRPMLGAARRGAAASALVV